MGVVYFTSNASTGAGSLAEAIQNARPGDVVRPDETVFERGATIEIALASQLNVNKDLTLDASPFRVSLNGGGAVRCLYISEGATVRVAGFDFVSGSTTSSGGGIYVADETEATFERCAILGCLGKYGGGAYAAGTAKFYDCLIAGCKATIGGGLSSVGATTVNGSTVAGCVASEGAACVRVSSGSFTATNSIFVGVIAASVTPVYSGCVTGVASSQIGFAAPPPDDLTVENWDANAWQSWDLRLLDDASGAPSPYRDSGAVDKISRYDLDGNFRGRETNGATSCSPGAYETLQADLFWIGVEIDPTAPSDLKVADYDAEAKTLILSWTPNLADATGYDVQYSTSGTGWANLTGAAADATSRLCGGLGAARTYIYRIRAYNAVGATAWSTIAFTPSALDEATAETGTREVVSPSLLASNGWAASRFARRPGDAAPQLGQTLFVDGVVSFSDILSTTTTQTFGLTLGGGAVVTFEPIQIVYCSTFTLGAGSTFGGLRGRLIGPRQRLRFGANAQINTTTLRISINDVWFDAGGYVAACECYAFAPPEPRYGALTLLRSTSATTKLSGAYNCESFKVARSSDSASYLIPTAPGASIRCRSFEYKLDFSEGRLFTNAVVVELYGDATATVSRTGTTTLNVADDFTVDATDATSATLTLDGQTVYGDAPNAAVKLTGSAKIDERGLDVASLTLNADATLELKDGARLKVGSVAAAEDSSFLADFSNVEASEVNLSGAEFALTGGTVCALGTLVATSGSTFVCAASDVSIASASIADSALDVADGILSFSGTSTFNDATASGDGYVVVPYETDLTGLDFDETETRVCFRGANVEKFAAVSNGRETTFRWTAENPDVPVVVEVRNGDDWDVVELHARGPAFSVASGPSGEAEFRAFDGDKFLTTSIYVPAFHAWLTYDNLFTSTIVVKSYKVVTEFILMSIYFNANEAPVFLARIEDSATSTPVAPEQVESIGLTAYALRLSRGVKKRVPLDGWVDVEVPTTAIQSELIASDPRWKQDSIGYNFLFEPDLREKQLFAQAGEYVVVISVKFKDGNPAPLVFEVAVK
jgi:hypothetical protein